MSEPGMLKHSQRIFSTGLAIVVATILAASAAASQVRFDNPAGPEHFVWAEPGVGGHIYITRSSSGQHANTAPEPDLFFLGTNSDSTVGSVVGIVGGQVQTESGGIRIAPLTIGQIIPTAGLSWQQVGRITEPDNPSLLPEGVDSHFGIAFTLADGIHFGWIGVVRNASILDAFAWGYETVPFMPIAAGAPEPATLAILVLGGIGILTRRRSLFRAALRTPDISLKH